MEYKNKTSEPESMYKTTFEAAAEGIMIADIETKMFLHVNQAICQMLGYSKKELEAMTVMDIHPRDSLEEIVAGFEAQARGERGCLTYPCLKKNGTVIFADITAAPAIIEGRKCNIGFFTDVTERVLAQEALRESNENLKKAQALAQIGDWKWTIATDKVAWSEELRKLFGYDMNNTAPSFKEMAGFYTPDSWNLLNEVVTRAATAGKPYEIETDQIRTDGTLIHTITRGEADIDASGKVIGLHGTVQDITEHKLVETALKLHSEILDLQYDSVYVCDVEGNITYVNRAACLAHGYTQEAFLNMNLRDIDDPESAKLVTPRIKQILETGSGTFEVNHLRKDGSLLPLESHTSLIEVSGKKMIMNVAHDITGRKKTQKEAEAHLQTIAKRAKEWQDTFDAVTDSVMLISPQHEFLRVNRAVADAIGKKPEELIGKKCYELVHGLSSPNS